MQAFTSTIIAAALLAASAVAMPATGEESGSPYSTTTTMESSYPSGVVTPGLSLGYTSYTDGSSGNATACDAALRSGNAGIPENYAVGQCVGFLSDTGALRIQLAQSSRDGCSVILYHDQRCEGDAAEAFDVHPGGEYCKPAIYGPWGAAKAICS